MLVSSNAQFPRTVDQLISPELAARLDRIDILSRRIFAGKVQGERRSKRRGQSVEFEDFRNYVPGDDLRHVDWNIFARLDRFFIKIFQEEEDLAFHLVIDASASMDAGSAGGAGGAGATPSKLVLAMRLAMCLGYVALVNNDRVVVSAFDGKELRRLEPIRGRRNVQRLASFLLREVRPERSASSVDAEPGVIETARLKGDFTSALRYISRTRTGKGVMVLLSDFLVPEGYQEGLRMLAGAAGGGAGGGGAGAGGGGGGGFDTYCLQILSPGELDPLAEKDPSGERSSMLGDMRLVDVETGRPVEVTITAEVVAKYRERVRQYIEGLRSFCAARGMSHALVRSDADLQTLLLDDLRRRGLLR